MTRRVVQALGGAAVSLFLGQAFAQGGPSCEDLLETVRVAKEVGLSPNAAIAAAERAGCGLPTVTDIAHDAPADVQIEALREALGAAQASVAELRTRQSETEAALVRALSDAERARAEAEALRAQQRSTARDDDPMPMPGSDETQADLDALRRQMDQEAERVADLTASLEKAREALSDGRARLLEMEGEVASLTMDLDESEQRNTSLMRRLDQMQELQANAERVALSLVSDRVGEILDGLGSMGCAPLEVEATMMQSARGVLTPTATVRGVVFGPAEREKVVARLDTEPFEIAYDIVIQATASGCPLVESGFETFSASSAGEDIQIRMFSANEALGFLRDLPQTSACADLAEILEASPVFAAFRDAVPRNQRGMWTENFGVLGACRWEEREGRYIQVYSPAQRSSYPIIILRSE